ncbi:MAG TPA: metalloregulator ArsR/SmtB family transcription factor [Thermoplasmata archaeon]|jgi:DNA-binding transcriptional ArsR family regulator|nr:metalloregulator ArsR/SmtB family transcription factor [Thermoplasmata archaeon]
MKSMKVIKAPDAFKLLADDTRRRIIYLLRAKEMTVSQIASDLNLTAQAIYHHIRKLKKSGMVEVSKEERMGHFIETYYRASAERFELYCGECPNRETEETLVRGALDGLQKLGLISQANPEVASKVVDIMKRQEELCGKSDWADDIGGMDEVDFFVKQSMFDFAELICPNDKDFDEFVKLRKDMRALLLSCRSKPTKAKKKS